jgi:hypothetical protein
MRVFTAIFLGLIVFVVVNTFLAILVGIAFPDLERGSSAEWRTGLIVLSCAGAAAIWEFVAVYRRG